MSWLFSQVLVEEYLGDISLDGEQSAPLNGNPTQQAYCAPDKMMDFSRLSRFGMTYKPLMETRGEELLMSFLAAFHAKTSVPQEKAQELMENEAECGEKWRGSFVKYNPDSSLWRTHQCSLLGDLDEFSETWPQWGLMRNGECWEQQMLAQTIRGTESGFLLPTPDTDNRDNKKVLFNRNAASQSGRSLATYARTFPTPTASDYKSQPTSKSWKAKGAINFKLSNPEIQAKWPTPRASDFKGATSAEAMSKAAARGFNPNLPEATAASVGGGQLNPTWVEWLMGWPLGWTDLKPLEMDKSHCVQQPPSDY